MINQEYFKFKNKKKNKNFSKEKKFNPLNLNIFKISGFKIFSSEKKEQNEYDLLDLILAENRNGFSRSTVMRVKTSLNFWYR
jgi:hypothetical protein